VVSRNSTIDSEAPEAQPLALKVINDDVKLLADVMCVGK